MGERFYLYVSLFSGIFHNVCTYVTNVFHYFIWVVLCIHKYIQMLFYSYPAMLSKVYLCWRYFSLNQKLHHFALMTSLEGRAAAMTAYLQLWWTAVISRGIILSILHEYIKDIPQFVIFGLNAGIIFFCT